MASVEVKNFYAGKNIFMTGATGFLGVALLEKIFRSIPDIGDIYLLMRPKKGKEIQDRLEEIKKNSVFEKLKETKSIDDLFSKVRAVAGDVGQVDMGLSASDKAMLTQKVNIIFHSAATLDFAETLKQNVDINLLGTRRVLELGKQCQNLKVFVHVSSAYVNSYKLEADEKIYPLFKTAEEIIDLAERVPEKELEEMTPSLLGDHPNTYTFTKHMAEHEVQKMESLFPCTIVRPSMIVGAWKEPVPGWTVSKNGPQGFLMGAAKGVIRRLPVATKLVYDYIPIDVVVNQLLVAGCHAAVTTANKVEVYHCTTSTRVPFKWANVEDKINFYLHKYPLKGAVWYPTLKFVPSLTLFKLSAFFFHIIPAMILDTVTKIAGGRPILMKLHNNVNSSLERLEKFIFTEWKFSADRSVNLQKWLLPSDQKDFDINVADLDWVQYFDDLSKGARIYLNKEKMVNINGAKAKDTVLMIVHLFSQAGILSLIWYLFACIFGTTMMKSAYVVPLVYALFSFLAVWIQSPNSSVIQYGRFSLLEMLSAHASTYVSFHVLEEDRKCFAIARPYSKM